MNGMAVMKTCGAALAVFAGGLGIMYWVGQLIQPTIDAFEKSRVAPRKVVKQEIQEPEVKEPTWEEQCRAMIEKEDELYDLGWTGQRVVKSLSSCLGEETVQEVKPSKDVSICVTVEVW